MAYQYEVVVFGFGLAGNEACLGAAKAGLNTLLVEDGSLGGTGMRRGSYAVRALRACATYFSRIENAAKAGAPVGTVEPDWTSWLTAQCWSSSDLSVEFSSLDR
jgi:dihydrolipoamide dehydrogenase